MFDFWVKTSGTWINVALVLSGSGLGLLLRNQLSNKMQIVITQAVGLTTIAIGVMMSGALAEASAGQIDGIILALVSLVLGGLLGEWLQIEDRLTRSGDWLKVRFGGGSRFTEGFVAASLLFCIGPMAILGSLNNGLLNDSTILVVKGTMDGLVSIALTGTYGIGVVFSVLPVILYQGGLSLIASFLGYSIPDPTTSSSVLLITGTGGIMILGLGINLLEIKAIRVASFLPALILCPLASGLARWLLSL